VTGMEDFAASAGEKLPGRHPLLALRHGVLTHRASLEWARSTLAELAER